MAKPQIRHLAIMTVDPEKLAKFYEQVFEMERIPRPGAGGSKAIYLTDGYITLALLHNRADGPPSGLNHFGFPWPIRMKSPRNCRRRPVPVPPNRPADRAFAETRATDPDGNNFDLSVRGYEG